MGVAMTGFDRSVLTGSTVGPLTRIRRRAGESRTSVLLGSMFLVLLAVAVIAPGVFTSVGPDDADPLTTLAVPGGHHWFGADENGRDIFTRVVYGARPSVLIGLGASALALVFGTLVGVLAAQGGRFVDGVISRLLDIVLSIPGLLLVLLVLAVLGPGVGNAIVGLALMTVPGYARIVRGEVLRVRGAQFVEAAYMLGLSKWRVVLRHMVPNAVGPVLALTTVGVGAMIVASSSLSFLGLGPQPPTAEWGAMLASSRDYYSVAWWTAVFPGVAITVTVLSISVVGTAVRRRVEGKTA
jgi:peptide/nickel transport system permease protein